MMKENQFFIWEEKNMSDIPKKQNPILDCVEGKESDLLNITKEKGVNVYIPKKEISLICEKFGIKKENFQSKKEDFSQIVKEYFKSNPEYSKHAHTILHGINEFLK